jgi:hypothetical protein
MILYAIELEALQGTVPGVEHLNRHCASLDTQCKLLLSLKCYCCSLVHDADIDRMPVRLGNFISKTLYHSKLGSKNSQNDITAVRFIDVPEGEQEPDGSSFWVNP